MTALGRIPYFDERSRSYPITSVIAPKAARRPRSYTWRIPVPYVINQGREGACVGFAIANEIMARPAPVDLGDIVNATLIAQTIYREAQRVDPWPGEDYEGTSVLAGMQTAKGLGFFREYRWAFGVDDVVLGISRHGPAVLGIPWFAGMYEPSGGWLIPRGELVGGHAILARAVKIVWTDLTRNRVDYGRSFVTLRNSWGPDWGIGGDARITLADLQVLLDQQGEAVFAVGRYKQPRPEEKV